MIFLTALTLGAVGSLHCIGMCGPIALALPHGQASRWQQLMGTLLYNLGRVLTYALLGFIFGLLGQTISLAGFQQGLSIVLGIGLLFVSIFSSKKISSLFTMPDRFAKTWRKVSGAFLRKRSLPGLAIIGLLNGLLPCGLVYVALAGATATGHVEQAVLFMVVFGVGTIPALFAVTTFGKLLTVKWRQSLSRLIPVVTAVLAVILVLRGLSLGIPYISPNLEKMQKNGSMHQH